MQNKNYSYGFLSIRSRILAFAVLVTIVPSITMGLLLESMLHATLEEKVEQKFIGSASLIQREISLWFKERVYDLSVFSDSSILASNLLPGNGSTPGSISGSAHNPEGLRTVETYLTTLQNQFKDYVRLFVLSRQGEVIAASDTGGKERIFPFPDDAVAQISDNQWFKSKVYFSSHNKIKTPLVLIGVPLFLEKVYEYEALLVIEVEMGGLLPLLEPAKLGRESGKGVYESLVDLDAGFPFLFSKDGAEGLAGIGSMVSGYHQGDSSEPMLEEYRNQEGLRLMGLLVPFSDLSWGLFIAEDYEQVFAEVIQSRNRNIIMVCCFGLIMGITAYLLTRQIMVPLSALTRGARKVAEGDLNVQLPVSRHDEIGFATSVFNEMVAELKQNQAKLEQLATTDPLTGLDNRKRIMATLRDHFDYYQRFKAECAVLMLDVDHFKSVNDTYGHQVGDAVLKQIALIFQQNLRNVDAAGRYGGEEFLVLLAESAEEEALQAAERIRKAVANYSFTHEGMSIRVHVSIGVSTILEKDKDEQAVIKRSDVALYKAKKGGRNQVVFLKSDGGEYSGGAEKIVKLDSSVKK